MNVIDAFWEERNLGVTCYEIQMERSDTAESAADTLDRLEQRQYMVVKIPSSRYDLVPLIQSRGYAFIETAIALETNYRRMGYRPPVIPQRLQKICGRCSWGPMNEADLAQLSKEIKKNIFKTDRIYIDPAFTKEQAAHRYDLWVKDLVKQGHIPYKVELDQKIIGFFVDKPVAHKVYQGILGGIYTEYEYMGLGYVCDYAGFMSALERGMERCVTSVSGNNPAILRLHTMFGAEVKELTYVFVKHNG